MGLVTAGVSLSWMTVVTIIPAWVRPYFDGSHDNSAYQQVFVYNGFGRLDQASPDQLLDQSVRLGLPAPPAPVRVIAPVVEVTAAPESIDTPNSKLAVPASNP